MLKRRTKGVLAMLMSVLLMAGIVLPLTACSKKKDSIVIMTEELSGLFNPFYATSGTDMDVVGMTQIGMLGTDKEGNPVAGDDESTVVKAFDYVINGSGEDAKTVYTFVIKNGLKFSDGKPLTMNDVMFNIYEYLDPVYTGSSTMYSIDIEGLSQYRTQTNQSGDDGESESQISSQAAGMALVRILEMVNIYEVNGQLSSSSTSYSLTEEEMRAAINGWDVSTGYMDAVATETEQKTWKLDDYRKQLLADYDTTLETFKEELESDYIAALESYDTTTAPWKDWKDQIDNDIFKFFLYEGYITPVYKKVNGREDKTVVEKFDNASIVNNYTTREAAIERVYNDTVTSGLNNILTQWGTAGTLQTLYAADATGIILRNNLGDDGKLLYPNISGVVSLGHTTNTAKVSVDGKDYTVAHDHNADGTPVSSDEYDVLQITVNGTDPKAIYNFGFTVAPAHYYTADAEHPDGRTIDIANDQFGVDYASSDFQQTVIQSREHVEVPVGAGPFAATDRNNSDQPEGSAFWSQNVVYFKANDNFMFDVKADKLRMQVVSSSDAIDVLSSGAVDYVVPQFTKDNADRLSSMEDKGFVSLDTWQLGYGYIGINAGKVPNVNIRRAIMSAMNTALATAYYQAGTCVTIDWPMSRVSWAYPFEDDGVTSEQNGHPYTQWTTEVAARQKITEYMNAAGVSAGDSQLSITFTIAGASITEHPCYNVFRQAQEILNDMGWSIELKADSQALTKLATGSLEVWAAAWGSTIDPDMYQVYHMNSTATSVYAWGYREIKSNTTLYSEEYRIIRELSGIIDDARESMDKTYREPLYKQAMSLVLDLAVELPVYQRKELFAYNSKTVSGFNNDVNPYSSPLEKVWELELLAR